VGSTGEEAGTDEEMAVELDVRERLGEAVCGPGLGRFLTGVEPPNLERLDRVLGCLLEGEPPPLFFRSLAGRLKVRLGVVVPEDRPGGPETRGERLSRTALMSDGMGI